MQQDRSAEGLPLRGRWLEYFWRGFGVLWLTLMLSTCSAGPYHRGHGQVGTAVAQIRNFKDAIELHTADRGQPPLALEWLITSPPVIPPAAPWKGPYLTDVTTVPLDPWQHPYDYEAPGPHGEPYWIISYGSDGRPGGEGTAADLTLSSELKTEFRWTGFWLPGERAKARVR